MVLQAAKKLHLTYNSNLKYRLRTVTWLFLDNNINVDGNKQVKCGWYQKPTDTGNASKLQKLRTTAVQEKYNRGYGAQDF